jgi:hypothetical protein
LVSHFTPQTKQSGKQFGQPNPHLKGPTFHEKWEIVDGEWLRLKEPDLQADGIFNPILKWYKCINMVGDYAG